MFYDTFLRRIVFNSISLIIIFILYFLIFNKLYLSDTIIISFAVHPFNICEKYPDIWSKIKLINIIITLLSSLICINHFYSFWFTKNKPKTKKISTKDNLSLFISKSFNR